MIDTTSPCMCGHSPEEHEDPRGVLRDCTATACSCCCYEPDPEYSDREEDTDAD